VPLRLHLPLLPPLPLPLAGRPNLPGPQSTLLLVDLWAWSVLLSQCLWLHEEIFSGNLEVLMIEMEDSFWTLFLYQNTTFYVLSSSIIPVLCHRAVSIEYVW
jgi:hypothetical protein